MYKTSSAVRLVNAPRRRVAMLLGTVLALGLVLGACSSSGSAGTTTTTAPASPSSVPTSSSTTGSTGSTGPASTGSTGSAPAGAGSDVAGSVVTPEQTVYYLVSDSDGKVPATGDQISLMFGGQGQLWFLATSSGGDLSTSGTWSYGNGDLTVDFSVSGLSHEATFPVSLGAGTVQMPFLILSPGTGSSTWSRQLADPLSESFEAALAADSESSAGESLAQVIEAGANYIGAVTGAKIVADPGFSSFADAPQTAVLTHPPTARVGVVLDSFWSRRRHVRPYSPQAIDLLARRMAAERVHSVTLDSFDEQPSPGSLWTIVIVEVDESDTGLLVRLQNGLTVDLNYAPAAAGPSDPVSLTPGPFAATPTIDDVPDVPSNPMDDPPTKTAAFIEPFYDTNFQTWSVNGTAVTATVGGWAYGQYNASEVLALENHGYTVAELFDSNASIFNIIKALAPSTPGFIYVASHGGSDGTVATGDYLGHDADDAVAAYDAIAARLAAAYPTFPGIGSNLRAPSAIRIVEEPVSQGETTHAYYLGLLPPFWNWLRSEGANFSQSLVYFGSCLTDASSSLRDAVQARAYFAFKISIYVTTIAAIADYLVTELVKPTFTAEEVYYNILRIDLSGRSAYKADNVFNGVLAQQQAESSTTPSPSGSPYTMTALSGIFDGWGSDGGQPIPYVGNGWLSGKVSEGQVWTLLFYARLGANTEQGIGNEKLCYNSLWSKGQLGGINSPFQDWTDGFPPTKDELDYAIYLLSGKNLGFSGTVVPRFTLNG